jgi:hypothetical protein
MSKSRRLNNSGKSCTNSAISRTNSRFSYANSPISRAYRAKSLRIVRYRSIGVRHEAPPSRPCFRSPHLPTNRATAHKRLCGQCLCEARLGEIAEMAILEWAGRNSPNSIPTSLKSGYQWKDVFLPNGTVLRTTFKGKNHHCLVEGDGLCYEGKLTSPSGFANLVGGTNRNAWKVVWILLPGTQGWTQASKLRPRVPAPPAKRRR